MDLKVDVESQEEIMFHALQHGVGQPKKAYYLEGLMLQLVGPFLMHQKRMT